MKRIIIADDDPGIQDIMEIILKRAGYQATIYGNANALLCNNFDEPDIFLIDKQLPDADGMDVCRFLKRRENTHTPVIMVSASNRLNEQAKDAGADDFLEKPFKIKALLEKIQKLTA